MASNGTSLRGGGWRRRNAKERCLPKQMADVLLMSLLMLLKRCVELVALAFQTAKTMIDGVEPRVDTIESSVECVQTSVQGVLQRTKASEKNVRDTYVFYETALVTHDVNRNRKAKKKVSETHRLEYPRDPDHAPPSPQPAAGQCPPAENHHRT